MFVLILYLIKTKLLFKVLLSSPPLFLFSSSKIKQNLSGKAIAYNKTEFLLTFVCEQNIITKKHDYATQ